MEDSSTEVSAGRRGLRKELKMPEHVLWDLTSIYPSMESSEYHADKDKLVSLSAKILKVLEAARAGEYRLLDWFPTAVEQLNHVADLSEHLSSYTYALWSTGTTDGMAQSELNDLEARSLAVKDVFVRFRSLLPDLKNDWEALLAHPELRRYRFWLNEQLFLASREMSPLEESLAADLQRCGGDAWDRLHDKLSSLLVQEWNGTEKTITQLRDMAYDPDRAIREKAWRKELAAWMSAEISCAAALNGVKGATHILNTRRGWGSTLEKSLFQNRLSRTALDSMLGVMTESLPLFRRYFYAKARILGLKQLSWFDLFAPVGQSGGSWSWPQLREFIPRMFDTLSSDMGDFSRRAFAQNWIDAQPREGKVGGAYCTHFPLAGESRILCNFNETFFAVSTVAHELGHAWHSEVMKDLPALNREYPLILGETASIFSETLVFRAALEELPPESKLSVLDFYLTGVSQLIVDILSRFHFESVLMRSRPDAELSPQELTRMMLDAQQHCYGDALVENERHGWMWAVKGHYYLPDLAFYNFPYAFGQLFALGLFAQFQESGGDFFRQYRSLLRSTGSDSAVELARSAGFNIESPDFWRRGLRIISEQIVDFENLGM